MTLQWLPEEFRLRVLSHLTNLNTLDRKGLEAECRQHFGMDSGLDSIEVHDDTLRYMIALKQTADDQRRLNEVVPKIVTALLTLAGERECTNQSRH